MDYMFFVLLGIIGGMLGALFNHIVEEMNEFRREHVNNYAWRRVFEVIVVALLTGTAAVCLPAAFMCKQELRAVMMEDSAGCLNAEDQFQLSHGTVSHPFLEALLNQAANCSADVVTSGTSSSGSAAASGSRMLLAAASSSRGTGSGTSSAGSGAASMMTATIPGILEELKKYRSGNSYLTLGGVEDVSVFCCSPVSSSFFFLLSSFFILHSCSLFSYRTQTLIILNTALFFLSFFFFFVYLFVSLYFVSFFVTLRLYGWTTEILTFISTMCMVTRATPRIMNTTKWQCCG